MGFSFPILLYHKLGIPPRGSARRGLHVTPKAFERQLIKLNKSGYVFLDFNDLKDMLEGRRTVPEKPILLTFDDGHLDNYTHGLPVLKKYGVKATVFVIASDMGKSGLVWKDAGERLPASLMSWEQAREMHSAGISIQSHGMTHTNYRNLSKVEIAAELEESRRLISREIGVPPVAFAYPLGIYDAEYAGMARNAGYSFACTVARGTNESPGFDPFALKRIPVKGYRWIHRLKFTRELARGFRRTR